MASQLSSRDSKDRSTRELPDALPWTSGDWPSSGRFRDCYWAQKCEMTIRNLRDLVYRKGIPHVPTGRVLWIDAEDMVTAFPKVYPGQSDSPKTKRKPTNAQTKDTKTRKR